MNFLSVCSGIEAASVAWGSLGWEATAFSEIEPFPSTLLSHHYPMIPNLGDMTGFRNWPSSVFCDSDIFVGGCPCQAFSVAGLRNSLSDNRGQLTLTFINIANEIDKRRSDSGKSPCIILFENVPGILSTKDNAFGCFLAGLAGEECELQPPGKKWANAGYVLGPQRAVAWRILDAQYFGVAQRRRRVFVVASARDDFDPAAVLFEFDGLRRDTPPSTPEKHAESKNDVNPDRCWWDGGQISQTLDAVLYKRQTMPEKNRFPAVFDLGRLRFISPIESERLQGFPDSYTNIPQKVKILNPIGSGPCAKQVVRATIVTPSGKMFSATNHCLTPVTDCPRKGLATGEGYELCKSVCNQTNHAEVNAVEFAGREAKGATLYLEGHTYACQSCIDSVSAAGIREVIIGKPPGNTADGPRYKALGNSMAVPVMAWIGRRIHSALTK